MDSVGLAAHEVSEIDASDFASSRIGDKSVAEENDPAIDVTDEVKQIRECSKLVETLTESLKEASTKLEVMHDTVRKTNALSNAWLSLWLQMTQMQHSVLRPAPRKAATTASNRRGTRGGRRVSSRRSSTRPESYGRGRSGGADSNSSRRRGRGRGEVAGASVPMRRSSMAPTTAFSSRRSLVGKAPAPSRQSLPVGASRRLIGNSKGKGKAGR